MSADARLIEARSATSGDLSEICEIEQSCFAGEAWSREGIVNFISGERVATAAVYMDGRIVSFACAVSVCDEAEIVKVATSPAYRRRGAARAAIERLISESAGNDIRRMLLEVRESNTSALGLYKSLGFREYSRRKNYYSSPREDAILMEKLMELTI